MQINTDYRQRVVIDTAGQSWVASPAAGVQRRMLDREGLRNHIIVVTRWYGGKHLGGDRFRHVQNAVRYYLDHRT